MTTEKHRPDKQKRKAYYRKCAAASKRYRPDSAMGDKPVPKQLHPGLAGYIVTCNNQERLALMEAYRLLNSALALYKPEPVIDPINHEEHDSEQIVDSDTKDSLAESHNNDDNGDDDDDIYSQLMKENSLATFKSEFSTNSAPSVQYSFYSVKTGVSNCLFILHTPTHVHPSKLVHDIFQRLLSSKLSESRHVLRLIPVAATCHASISALGHCLKVIWSTFVGLTIDTTTNATTATVNDECPIEIPTEIHEEQPKELEGTDEATQSTSANPMKLPITPQIPFGDILHGSKTFCVNFKARNYDRLTRDDAISAIVSTISSLTPEWRVSYSSPAVVISVNIFRNVACISLLENFDLYRKYNVAELIYPTEETKVEPSCPESNVVMTND